MQHLDEGTIHAWLDGQLPREEAQQVEAHVAECRQCADAVAEARGLIAASSRILLALDEVPRDVVPASAPPHVGLPAAAPAAHEAKPSVGAAGRARRRWFNGVTLAAAATIVVAIGITLTLPSYKQSSQLADRSSPTAARTPSTDTPVVTAPLPVVAAPPAPSRALGATGQPAEQRFVATTPANETAKVLRREVNQPAPRPAPAAVDERADVARVVDSAGARAMEIPKVKAAEPVDVATRELRKDAKAERLQSVAAAPQATTPPRDTMQVTVFRGVQAARADSSVGSVRGRVTDANNTGLAGAMVTVVGTTTGVVTNAAGEYTVGGLTSGSHRLLVRRIGYDSASRDVTVTAGQTTAADLVLRPLQQALSEVVTTGMAASAAVPARKPAQTRDRAAAIETAPGAPVTATQSNAIGCYELGITPTTPSRNGFRDVPRRVALDADIVPANADGVWYRARDLARTASVPNGLWRPSGTDAVEIEWTYGSRTARIRVAGPAGTMMRGSLEEIDRATATGEAGNVVAVRRPCAP